MRKTCHGFSLIEIICVLLILGIIAAASTIGISRTVQQLNFTKDNDALSQKVQVALNRMLVEFSYIDRSKTVMSGTANSITYPTTLTTNGAAEAAHTFDLVNGVLRWDANPLCNEISSLSFQYVTSTATASTLSNPTDLQKILVTVVTNGQQGAQKTFSAEIAMKL
jgi:prepilin-type N-terminal cleavage/methylation domain-containing protein